jgi:hypothetical protein
MKNKEGIRNVHAWTKSRNYFRQKTSQMGKQNSGGKTKMSKSLAWLCSTCSRGEQLAEDLFVDTVIDPEDDVPTPGGIFVTSDPHYSDWTYLSPDACRALRKFLNNMDLGEVRACTNCDNLY